MPEPIVSIIIPTTGKNRTLKTCLKSIKKQVYPQSKIQSITITNKQVLNYNKSWSFASAVNLAVKKAKGKYLLITNDDIFFEENAVQNLITNTTKYPKTILGANLTLKDKNGLAPSGYKMNLWTGIAQPVYPKNYPTPCDWVSGCALFLAKNIFEKLKGFDESFSPGFFEDADFCLRAKTLGIICLLMPNVKATHHQTTTFNLNKTKKYEYWYRNKILFLKKHASTLQLASSLTLQYALFTPARAILKHDRRFLPAIKGLYSNFSNPNL